MKQRTVGILLVVTGTVVLSYCVSHAQAACPAGIDPRANQPLAAVAPVHELGSCHIRYTPDGSPLPDPLCTPGAVNPTVTAQVLRDPNFKTDCVRDQLTTGAEKRAVYGWYGITVPAHNYGRTQECELDHLVSLNSGGGDGLENIWPQCDFRPVSLSERYFRVKDAAEVRAGSMIKQGADPIPVQHQLAEDWTKLP